MVRVAATVPRSTSQLQLVFTTFAVSVDPGMISHVTPYTYHLNPLSIWVLASNCHLSRAAVSGSRLRVGCVLLGGARTSHPSVTPPPL